MKELHFIVFGALEPVDNGYKSTATQLVRALSRHVRVTLFRLPKLGESSVAADNFDARCAELGVAVVRVVLQRDLRGQSLVGAPLAAVAASARGRRLDWSMALRAAGLGEGSAPLMCFGMGWDPFAVAALQDFPHATYFPADSITLFEKNRRASGWLKIAKRRAATAVAAWMERRVARSRIERIVFVSPRDAACVARIARDRRRVGVVPIGIDPAEFEAPSALPLPATLLFSGVMDYLPNRDAAAYLIEEIFPLVKAQGVRLRIVGKGAGGLSHMGRAGVEFVDWVPSLPAALRQGSIFVCPLRMGAGAKNKVIQAMAAGVPVVGTRSSFTGFSVRPPGTFVCEVPGDFAATIDGLAADRAALVTAGRAAREFTLKQCTWDASARRLLQLMRMI